LIRTSGSTFANDRAGAAGFSGGGTAEDEGAGLAGVVVAVGVVFGLAEGAGEGVAAVVAGAVATGTGLRDEKANDATRAITPIARTAPAPMPTITNALELAIEEPAEVEPAEEPTTSMRPHFGQEIERPRISGVAANC